MIVQLNLIYILEIIGTFVFAVSGVSTAAAKRFDVLGVVIIAFVTSIGGGTLRDIMIGVQPVSWMLDINYVYTIAIAVFLSFFFLKYLLKLRRTLFLFDTIGLGIFTILGLERALAFGLSPVVAVMMGTVSAVFGGVIRDILSNTVPLIFGGQIYASTCVVGGIAFLVMDHCGLTRDLSMIFTVLIIVLLRILAVRGSWSLPTMR